MIDPNRALGADLPQIQASWDEDEVILYHLGLGAGDPPTDPGELTYVYERDLKVLPTLAVAKALSVLGGLPGVPGMEFDFGKVLHGEQGLTVPGPLPTKADVTIDAKVAAIYDKGSAAVTVVEATTRDAGGKDLAVSTFTIFMRDAGGFGGERGGASLPKPPETDPDATFQRTTLPQQALIYRLSGDKNPLHADPEAAKYAGFDTPILHGLSTYGVVCKAVVDELLDGDVGKVGGYATRFAGVVFPGETLEIRTWSRDGTIAVEARAPARDAVVLSGQLTLA